MSADWYADDGFWEEMYPLMFTRRRLEGTASEVDRVVHLLDLTPGAAVLDMPCGAGRHSLALARRGFEVTGVDLSPGYLGRAREAHAAAQGRGEVGGSLELVQADMRGFRREGAFDAAVNLYSSFGYFEDPADDWRVLENLLASLKPGGRLLLELLGKETLALDFKPRRFEERDGYLFLERVEVQGGWTRAVTRWTVIGPDGTRRDRRFTTRLYSAAVLTGMLARVGFAGTAVFGSLWGIPYDHNAERLVVMAVKG